MQVVFPRKATYQKSITKTFRKCESKFRKILLFILAVGSLGGRTHFQRFMEIEVLKKNTDVLHVDIRHCQPPTLYAEIYGAIINQQNSRTRQYKTGRKY